MWRSRVLLLALVVVACSGPEPVEEPINGSGAESPERAVELLIEYFAAPNFDAAAPLAYPGHAALAALAEGASFAEVADALRNGDLPVAANFWSGFAQGAGAFLTSEVEVVGAPSISRDRIEFGVAEVTAEIGARSILTRESDGHRVDLFASFGAGLATQMIPAVERLLNLQNDDSTLILIELNKVVPSLLLASSHEWVPPTAALDVIRLVELITRVR